MNRFDWKETIKINIFMLKTVGLWPTGDESYGRNVYTLYAIVSTALFQIGHIFFQTVNLFLSLDNLQAVTGTIFILLMEMAGTLKTYCLVKNMKMLKQLMVTVNCDSFQPKNMQQRNLIQPNINAWKRFVSTFWLFIVFALFFCCSFPVLDKTVREYRLPFLAWYPYETKTSPQYEFTYIYQALAISFLALVNVNIDSLIAALNMFIAAQFDILCDDLRRLHCRGKNVIKILKNSIYHHREILKFADYANQFYNWLLLVQFFVGGVSLGLSLFQMTIVVPFSSEFYMLAAYENAVLVGVFMYCWFGNEIEIKSSTLSYAVFESDWTSFSPDSPKINENICFELVLLIIGDICKNTENCLVIFCSSPTS
ncbi:7tm 6 domain containing protein, partial [Asbolus verrucosus]